MSDASRNMTVGAFVVVGLVLLGVLIVWFGEEPDWLKRMVGGGTYPLHISFDELSDVESGTEVRMAVGPVGRVAEVNYKDPLHPGEGIDVVVEIRVDIHVPSNAVAVVRPRSMLSRSYVMLTHPHLTAKPVPQDGSGIILGEVAGVLDSVVPPGLLVELEKAVAAIANLADGLTPVSHDLHTLFQSRPTEWVDEPPAGMADITANISTAVERFDRTLKHVDEVIGDPETQSHLRETITNLHRMSEDGQVAVQQFRELSKELRVIGEDTRAVLARIDTTFDHADENVVRLTRKLMDVSDQLSTLLSDLQVASTNLSEGKGTAALLLNDNRLYEEMVLTLRRLTAAAEDLQNFLKDVQERGLKARWN